MPPVVLLEQNLVRFDWGTTFLGTANPKIKKTFIGFREPHESTPALDPDYHLVPELAKLVCFAIEQNQPIYLFGPTGSGKTSLPEQIAARTNWPVYRFQGGENAEVSHLLGAKDLQGDRTPFVYGPLALAVKYGGIFLYDEMPMSPPGVNIVTHAVLDDSPLVIPENGGEVIPKHPYFRFVATGNDNGQVDETGWYAGSQPQNLATLDRFHCNIEVDYLKPEVEVEILKKAVPEVIPEAALGMVKLAGLVREGFLKGNIEAPLSTRKLVRWARLTQAWNKGGGYLKMLEMVFANRLSLQSRNAVLGFYETCFKKVSSGAPVA